MHMKHKVALLWSWFVSTFTWFLPDIPLTMRFRGRLYGIAMKICGKDFQVARGVTLRGLENISVGDHVYLAPGVVILASVDVIINDQVMLSYNTVIASGNHSLENGSYRFGPMIRSIIKIGYGSWLGANSTVVAGVNIGRSVLVAANSVVVKNIPDNCIVGGVPANIIGNSSGHHLDCETSG